MKRAILFGLLAALVIASAWIYRLCVSHEKIRFLPDRAGATWIVYPTPPDAHVYTTKNTRAEFRRSFELTAKPATAPLTFLLFNTGSVVINGRRVELADNPSDNWKAPRRTDVAQLLQQGTNQISVSISNTLAPPALSLRLDAGEMTITTDEQWESSLMGAVWAHARAASAPGEIRPGNSLHGGEDLFEALQSTWREQLFFILLSAGIATALQRRLRVQENAFGRRDSTVLLLVIVAAWVFMFLNNMASLPDMIGFDAQGHLDYIHYIQKNGKLPLADEGWEMFQPPLYYISTALLLKVGGITHPHSEVLLLRVVGMLVGIANFVLVFANLRLLFPARLHVAIWGLLLAAFVPAHLYMSQYITNEVLAATLVNASIYFCLRILRNETTAYVEHLALGVCLGAALLAKATALLAVPLVLIALFGKCVTHKRNWTALGLTALIAALVCGWHYVRVWRHFGNPLIGNWDLATGQQWWQADGFRTAAYFFRFGKSLFIPYFSGLHGFGDGLYSTFWADGLCGGRATLADRPPWNYPEMTVACFLAIIPTIAILFGLILALRKLLATPTPQMFLLLSFAGLTFLAIIYMSLKVASYAQVKAFYGLVALTPLCFFGAIGLEFFSRNKLLSSVAIVAVSIWALNSYAAFFVRPKAVQPSLLMISGMIREGKYADARDKLAALLEKEPKNANAWAALSNLLLFLGRPADAFATAERGLAAVPDHLGCRFWRIAAQAEQGRLPEAIEQTRDAATRAPDHPLLYRNLAAWLLKTGRTNEAITAARESLRITPYDAQAQASLAAAGAKE